MLTQLVIRLVLLVAILSTVCAQQASERQNPAENPSVLTLQNAHPQPITEDLSRGATFTFKIANDLPEFAFKVIPDAQKSDQYGNPTTIIQDVQVFRGTSGQPLQSLEDCEWEGMEAPPKGSDWFRAEDMNFDGYKDVYVLTNWGATGNQLGCIWLYDPASGHFEYSKEFSDLTTFTLDPTTKTITTHGNGGMAGTVFRATKYAIENNRPVLIMTVAQDWDIDKKQYHCVVEQRRGGKLMTIRDVWAAPKNDFDAPCDAGEPFRGVGEN